MCLVILGGDVGDNAGHARQAVKMLLDGKKTSAQQTISSDQRKGLLNGCWTLKDEGGGERRCDGQREQRPGKFGPDFQKAKSVGVSGLERGLRKNNSGAFL